MKPELLAPAGSWEALTAAVQNGADAVYLGLKQYSARKAADNFTQEELSEALSYCHTRGVKVYLTLNTLIGEKDTEDAYGSAMEACDAGIDGIIVQDLGLAERLIRSQAPVHSSTQLTVYNKEGAEKIRQLGFTRCVLARELSLEEIKTITESVPIETEVFCHGALCMSYSGQCLMSFCQGGRSGNKGDCAQPCRMAYRFDGGKMLHHLSPADLCTLPFLDRLTETGVTSLKIEGRLKNAAYVGTVTGIYRKAIDRISAGNREFCTREDTDSLALAFCRNHFTAGHLLGKMPSKDITLTSPGRTGLLIGHTLSEPRYKKGPVPLFEVRVQLDRPLENGDGIGFSRTNGGIVNGLRNDILTVAGTLPEIKAGEPVYQTYSKAQNREWKMRFENGKENRKTEIEGHFTAEKGKEILLTVTDGRHWAEAKLPPPPDAVNNPTTEADIRKALDTLGNTPYKFSRLEIHLVPGLFLPASQLKELKRSVLGRLTELRTQTESRAKYLPYEKPPYRKPGGRPGKRSYFFYRTEDFLRYVFSEAPYRIYLPLQAFRNSAVTAALENTAAQIFAVLPFINKEDGVVADIEAALPHVHGFLAQNIGDTVFLEKYAPGKERAADISFNTVNTAAAEVLRKMGFTTATLSPETDGEDLPVYPEGMQTEIIIKGPIPVMRSEHCLIATAVNCAAGRDCGVCRKEACRQHYLEDEKGGRYPILTDREHCRMTLLSKESADRIQKNLPGSARTFYGDRLIERINIFMEE